MRASSPSENVVSSTKTMPSEAPEPVSSTSPWNTGEPELRLTCVPSARATTTSPSTVSTRPIGCAAAAGAACAT